MEAANGAVPDGAAGGKGGSAAAPSGKKEVKMVIVGDGAVLCERALTEAGLPCRLAPAHLVMQSAVSVALCGEDLARAGKLVSAQELLPVYLRPPQAQRLRDRLQT